MAGNSLNVELGLLDAGFVGSLHRVRDELGKQTAAMSNSIDRMAKSLQTQLDTFGRSAQEIELYKAAQKGASDAQLANIQTLQQLLNLKRQEAEADAKVVSEAQAYFAAEHAREAAIQLTISSLKNQLATFGMSSNELIRYTAAQQGATRAELAEMGAIQEKIALKKLEASMDAQVVAEVQQSIQAENSRKAAIEGVIQSLHTELSTLGMTEAELTRYKAAQKGATEAELAEIGVLQQQIAAKKAQSSVMAQMDAAWARTLQKQQQNRAAIESSVGALQKEAAQIGLSSSQIKLRELALQGATAAELQMAKASLTALEAQQRFSGGILGAISGYKVLGGLAAGAFAGSALVKTIDEWTSFNNTLKLTTKDAESFKKAQSGVIDTANATGQSLSAVSAIYRGLQTSQDRTGLSTEGLLKVTETVSQAVMISGQSAQASEMAITQFGQALNKGKLNGDEFNSVMEQAPGLAKAIADGMNMPVGKLKELATQGALTSKEMVTALGKSAPGVADAFSKMDLTISQSLQVLHNNFTRFIGQTSDATGAAKMLSGVIRGLANNLDIAAYALGGIAAIQAGKWVMGLVSSFTIFTAQMYLNTTATQVNTAALVENAAAQQALGVATLSSGRNVATFGQALPVALQGARAGFAAATTGALGFVTGLGALAVAVGGAVLAFDSFQKMKEGRDAANWLSDKTNEIAAAVGLINAKTESLGTKLAELTQGRQYRIGIELAALFVPGSKLILEKIFGKDLEQEKKLINIELNDPKAGGKTAAYVGQSQYQGFSNSAMSRDGVRAAYEGKTSEELNKELKELSTKYAENAQMVGMSTEQQEAYKFVVLETAAKNKALAEINLKDGSTTEARIKKQQDLIATEAAYDKELQEGLSNLQKSRDKEVIKEKSSDLKKMSEEMDKARFAIGRTAEQAKVAEAEDAYRVLVQHGASQEILKNAAAYVEHTKAMVPVIEQVKKEEEARNKEKEKLKQVGDNIEKLQEQNLELAQTIEVHKQYGANTVDLVSKLEGMKAASKGASAEQIAQTELIKKENEQRQRWLNAQQVLEGLQKEIDQFGMNDQQKKLDDLRRQGADGRQMGQAASMLQTLAQLQAKKDAESSAKTMNASNTMTKAGQSMTQAGQMFQTAVDNLKAHNDAIDNQKASFIGPTSYLSADAESLIARYQMETAAQKAKEKQTTDAVKTLNTRAEIVNLDAQNIKWPDAINGIKTNGLPDTAPMSPAAMPANPPLPSSPGSNGALTGASGPLQRIELKVMNVDGREVTEIVLASPKFAEGVKGVINKVARAV